MTSARQSQINITPVGVRRLGYFIGIAISAGILFVVNNLLAWDIVPFLTADFDQLLPIVNASLVVVVHVVSGVASSPAASGEASSPLPRTDPAAHSIAPWRSNLANLVTAPVFSVGVLHAAAPQGDYQVSAAAQVGTRFHSVCGVRCPAWA